MADLDFDPAPPRRSRIWRRRLVALVVILGLIALPVYLLFIKDDDEPAEVKAVTDPAEAAKLLTQAIGDETQGIELHFPEGWVGEKQKPIIRVTSEDNTTGIAIVSKGRAVDAKTVFRNAVNSVKRGLKKPKVVFAKKTGPVSGLPAASAVIRGVDAKGVPRNAQLIVARGANRSYVITVLVPPGGGQIGVANLIISQGLRLTD